MVPTPPFTSRQAARGSGGGLGRRSKWSSRRRIPRGWTIPSGRTRRPVLKRSRMSMGGVGKTTRGTFQRQWQWSAACHSPRSRAGRPRRRHVRGAGRALVWDMAETLGQEGAIMARLAGGGGSWARQGGGRAAGHAPVGGEIGCAGSTRVADGRGRAEAARRVTTTTCAWTTGSLWPSPRSGGKGVQERGGGRIGVLERRYAFRGSAWPEFRRRDSASDLFYSRRAELPTVDLQPSRFSLQAVQSVWTR
mmetsp:Transcript_8474/g.27898  ORF Transcript_8474/g.27898 Transcript_8474/m.27898 type:complete len:249 (-) Transcript_8474:1064-1810(-)